MKLFNLKFQKNRRMPTIPVNDQIHLTPYRLSDKAALIEYINDPVIHRNTLTIPFPYGEKEADEWLELTLKEKEKFGIHANWVIRNNKGKLIGCIGRQLVHGTNGHADEVGYWLARPYWGKGIMTEVVQVFCDFLFAQGKLIRLTAAVFAFNAASAKVLEKTGFERKGYLKKHYLKNGEYLDGILYAKLKSDL